MTVLAESGRRKLWFGTVNRMGWFPTPNRGANVSPEGWSAGGSLLNGGAYQFRSFNSAKNYVFEWPSSSSREDAQLLKSYADGSYGRGLIYFVDPLIYDTNVLPAMWADPSMGIASEANSLVPGVIPGGTPTSANPSFQLPSTTAYYDLGSTGTTGPSNLDDANSVFIPIPEGHALAFGAFYFATGSAGVFYSPVFAGGGVSGYTQVTPVNPTGSFVMNTIISTTPGQIGIRVWTGKSASGPATISISAMHARLFEVEKGPGGGQFWMGGQGNSGCQFISYPTYVNNSPINGGQVGFAASFREIGSWVVG